MELIALGTTGRGEVASPLDERRQRAREAFWDSGNEDPESLAPALESAIETATRVKLTDDVVDRYQGDRFDPDRHARRRVMREVLEACGFEVEQ